MSNLHLIVLTLSIVGLAVLRVAFRKDFTQQTNMAISSFIAIGATVLILVAVP